MDPKTCSHDTLRFEAGALYLVCQDCGATYAAVMNPFRIIQDIMARSRNLEGQFRSNPMKPFSLPIQTDTKDNS